MMRVYHIAFATLTLAICCMGGPVDDYFEIVASTGAVYRQSTAVEITNDPQHNLSDPLGNNDADRYIYDASLSLWLDRKADPPRDHGVVVHEVRMGFKGWRAGIRAGSIIDRINTTRINSIDDFQSTLANPGDSGGILLTWLALREGTTNRYDRKRARVELRDEVEQAHDLLNHRRIEPEGVDEWTVDELSHRSRTTSSISPVLRVISRPHPDDSAADIKVAVIDSVVLVVGNDTRVRIRRANIFGHGLEDIVPDPVRVNLDFVDVAVSRGTTRYVARTTSSADTVLLLTAISGPHKAVVRVDSVRWTISPIERDAAYAALLLWLSHANELERILDDRNR